MIYTDSNRKNLDRLYGNIAKLGPKQFINIEPADSGNRIFIDNIRAVVHLNYKFVFYVSRNRGEFSLKTCLKGEKLDNVLNILNKEIEEMKYMGGRRNDVKNGFVG